MGNQPPDQWGGQRSAAVEKFRRRHGNQSNQDYGEPRNVQQPVLERGQAVEQEEKDAHGAERPDEDVAARSDIDRIIGAH